MNLNYRNSLKPGRWCDVMEMTQ